jgi:hypothetical protein
MNKKGVLGIQWDLLVLALLISSGILLFYNNDIKLPDVGAYSEATTYAIEGKLGLIKDIRYFLNNTNEATLRSFINEEHIIFDIESYCESEEYKDLAKETQFEDDTGTLEVEYVDAFGPKNIERECYVLEEELANYYGELFVKKYNDLRREDLTFLDLKFNEVRYESKIEEESEFYNIVEPKDPFTYPIFIEDERRNKEEIGNFKLNPSFKFLVDYNFNDENKEICILSRDCGATCNEVMEKYPSGERDYNGYEIIDEGTISVNENTATHLECERYYDCETPLDDFGKTFKCDRGVLCEGACLPFCAVIDTNLVTDDLLGNQNAGITQCVEFSCGTYMDCSYTGTCGCPDPSAGQPPGILDSACIGNDCRTINCATDSEFEGKIRKITSCQQEECSYYDRGTCDDASSINPTCECKPGEGFACVGECSCKVQRQGTNSCSNSNIDCGFNEVINVNYPQCQKQTEYECGSCLPSCDTVCGCDYGKNGDMFCGPCGKDPCYVVGECTQDGFSCTDEWTCNEAEDPACSSNPEPDCIDQCMGDVLCEADCVGFQ